MKDLAMKVGLPPQLKDAFVKLKNLGKDENVKKFILLINSGVEKAFFKAVTLFIDKLKTS